MLVPQEERNWIMMRSSLVPVVASIAMVSLLPVERVKAQAAGKTTEATAAKKSPLVLLSCACRAYRHLRRSPWIKIDSKYMLQARVA